MAKKSKKTRIPRELKRAGALCLAFANTGFPRRDDRRRDATAPPSMPLLGYDELVVWGVRMGALGDAAGERLRWAAAQRPEDAASAVAQAARLRAAAGRLFTSRLLDREPQPPDLAIVTDFLRLRLPVSNADGFRWDWAGADDALDQPLWPIAQSAAELLVGGGLDKVRQCSTRGCFQLFVGGNRRRQWCDTNTCGSRAKGKRYQDWKRRLRGKSARKSSAQIQADIRRYKQQRLEQDQRDHQSLVASDPSDAKRQP